MNKAITDDLNLMPAAFEAGLDQWARGNGTPGSDTYAGLPNAALVAGDADFGSCLELQKTDDTQRLRYMQRTPILPGCYLQVRVRLKVLSGALPSARIAAWASSGGNTHLNGVVEAGPVVSLDQYGRVFELRAIIGSGQRGGVDMAWGRAAQYGHIGLDLTGPNGGIVRIDDIVIEDVTSIYLRDMLSLVDVRDFGALGDNSFDNRAAFEAADQAAEGRRILVPEGQYYIANSLTLDHEVVFEGTLRMPTGAILILRKNFEFPSYAAAFGNEELAFRKGFQALLNNPDHDSFNLKGRQISISRPIDMQAATPNRLSYSTHREIRNGLLVAESNNSWDTDVVTSQATYDPDDKRKLQNVANAANIQVGSLVEGAGVGREIYVAAVNVGAREITLNEGLYDAAGSQVFTFRHFKCMLDFSGFSLLSKFGLRDVELQCNSRCSAIRLAPTGATFALDGCFVVRPKDRGITSMNTGCQGLLIDNCQFLSAEDPLPVSDRTSIAFNVNANDLKVRNCRATRFRHFCVLGGDNNTITGNHFFQGDNVAGGVRSAGIVLTSTYCSSTISDNYIDNCSIEWTNERDEEPDYDGGFSFSALSITDNVFLSAHVAPWFSPIVVKPYGRGHFLNGVVVSGNKFRSTNGSIERAERVDTTFSDLDMDRANRVFFDGNTFHGIDVRSANPLRLRHDQNASSRSWRIESEGQLPFEGELRGVDSIVPLGPIETASGADRFNMPYVQLRQGSARDALNLVWPENLRGEVMMLVRMDR
ncbi:right-handed parallel beta-helix repeat-containing protein [Epibacterium sp. SM1969]|uniref:Right-handed parallel beta-helix repeat-containing protein n=1 Tax=Tritonibacter aquimaris TaxID=2663379 RepID=A0A844ALN2_9RHOB|nr:right-handed parallel beta-helix repeat-containing protein [Tritonibacter aquimaris]MQY42609.1 right-handed parallel beta-helix repeat-containing protein [Tritonibacter aquimaris]